MDDSEVDAAIIKLDEALRRYEELTGKPEVAAPERAAAFTMEEALGLPALRTEEALTSLDQIEACEAEALQSADAADLAESEALDKLDDVEFSRGEAEAALAKIRDLEAEAEQETGKVRGQSILARRLVGMIPGGSELYSVYAFIRQFAAYGVGVGGLLALIAAVKFLLDWQKEQEREAAEYRRMVMEARGFVKISEFDRWQENQRRTFEGYVTRGVIP